MAKTRGENESHFQVLMKCIYTTLFSLDYLAELQRLYVHDFVSLGLQLGLSREKLRYIEASEQSQARRLIEVIYAWEELKDGGTWEELGLALVKIPDHKKAGYTILKKYSSSMQSVMYTDRSAGESCIIKMKLNIFKF